jgi:hypothetical protein
MNWLEPWYSLSGSDKEPYAKQLRKEITSGHKLAHLSFEVIGKSGASDDVLIKIEKGEFEFAVVHLVWNGSVNHLYPRSYFYKDWQDFVDNRMKEDNLGYEE